MKELKIPTKNYVLALFIVIFTIFITLFLANMYNEKKEYELLKNVRMDFLDIIDSKSIDNYIVENHDVIIYLSNSSDINYESYEKQLKRLIIAMEYEKDIIYLDTKDVDSDFYTKFKEKYFTDELKQKNIELNIIPNLLIIKEGKVNDILYTVDTSKKASDVINFIDENGAIE
ncbi:MAG: hypothetical protein PHN42_01265 [Bacilli bacterium]|nr:hypothetical protein [Bacilli bacterium]